MSKYIYIVNEYNHVYDYTVSKCVRAFENIEDAKKYFSTLIEENKDKVGGWFDIQRCELEEENEKDNLATDLKQIVRDSAKQTREIIDNWSKGIV